MTKLEVKKIETDIGYVYELIFTYNETQKRILKLSENSYLALKEHFNKPKKEKKKPADAPTLEEVKEYFKKEGYQEETAIRFYKYYDSMDWYDANSKPVLRWKSKAISTWFKPDNKLKEEIKSKSKFFE